MFGPWFFCWADANEIEFGPEHVRVDEEIVSFALTHDEGDFPTLEITLRNPRVGLLAPGRKLWAWLSYDREPDSEESESESDHPSEHGIYPLFFGRLVGMPDDLDQELIRLVFIARPEDYQAQKEAVAASKKVRPYWDAIWFAPETRNDPDNILESRPELWHIDRTTLQVSTSHILNGEDGTLALDESEVFHESVQVSYGSVPARRVEVIANVSWNQNAIGLVNLSRLFNFGAAQTIKTYTGEGLVSGWPKSGTDIGGGWSVADGSAVRVDGSIQPEWGYKGQGVILPGYSTFSRATEYHDVIVPELADAVISLFSEFPAHALRVYRWQIVPTLVARYTASRRKNETLTFVLAADVQAILTEPGDEEVIKLGFSSSEVASAIDPGGALPIGDIRRPVYFGLARGQQSIEYLIALARSRLLARARTVNVEMEIAGPLAVSLELSCRKGLVLEDSRLPGGLAGGKITSYTITMDGESGLFIASITIGCTIGKGGTITAIPGEPTYVEEGYVEPGYQAYDGAFILPFAGDVRYESQEGKEAVDDGVDFSRMTLSRVVESLVASGLPGEQEAAMGERAKDPNTVFERLNAVPTQFALDLVPVTGGPFQTNYAPALSDLKIPKTINLEAVVVPLHAVHLLSGDMAGFALGLSGDAGSGVVLLSGDMA